MVASFLFFLLTLNLYALSYKDVLEILRKNPFSPERIYNSSFIKKLKVIKRQEEYNPQTLLNFVLGVVKKDREKYILIRSNNKIVRFKEGDILFGKYKILLIAKDKVVLLKTDNNEEVIISFKREKNGNKDFNKRK